MKEIVEAINQLGETGWMNYVKLGATVVSLIISTMALIFAIIVPIKIAKRQDQIALFEKRYNLYVRFTKVTAFIKVLETNKIKTKDEGVLEFINFVGDNNVGELDSVIAQAKAKSLLFKVVGELGQVKYLFELKSDKLIQDFCGQLISIIKAYDDDDFLIYLEELGRLVDELNEQIRPTLEDYLHI